jgi:copper chaperone CopZ
MQEEYYLKFHSNNFIMKTIKNVLFLLFIFISANVSAQKISSAELQVTGLTCSMCSRATETSLRTLNFIDNITADLNRNLFLITFKKGNGVNIDLIREKVKDAGFSIGSLSTVMNFDQTKIDGQGQALVDGKVYQFINAKNQLLNGPVKATVLDKNFVSNAVFKKNLALFSASSYAKGVGVVNKKTQRIYHLSI